jgi:hypothetical protein
MGVIPKFSFSFFWFAMSHFDWPIKNKQIKIRTLKGLQNRSFNVKM